MSTIDFESAISDFLALQSPPFHTILEQLMKPNLARFTLVVLTMLLGWVCAAPRGGTAPTSLQNARLEEARTQRLAIPAYFYPTKDHQVYWEQLRDASKHIGFIVATGLMLETDMPDPNYQEEIRKTRAAGVRVLAYVSCIKQPEGAVPQEEVKRQIDHAYAWYKVDGIFFDMEKLPYPVPCDKRVDYYKALSRYAKTKDRKAITVINHGQILPECYASAADILLNAEMDYAGYKQWKPAGWEARYPARKFWHVVHEVDTIEQMQEVAALSKARNAGYVFVTSGKDMDKDGGAYGSLPPDPFWSALLKAVSGVPH